MVVVVDFTKGTYPMIREKEVGGTKKPEEYTKMPLPPFPLLTYFLGVEEEKHKNRAIKTTALDRLLMCGPLA